MSDGSSNDNAPTSPPAEAHFDAHGQAALLLVESLIHGLIEQSVISVAKAVEVTDVALEVSRMAEEERAAHPPSAQKPTALLRAISSSLSADLPKS